MKRCKEIEKDLILYYYEEIDPPTGKSIEEHISVCKSCHNAWENLIDSLNAVKPAEPALSDSFWHGYFDKVYRKIEKRRRPLLSGILRPAFVRIAVATVLFVVVISGGFKLYQVRQERTFITRNYELIRDIEMFEDFEVIQLLDELEGV